MSLQIVDGKVLSLIRKVELENLKKGELCIFTGAGISYNSGIPLVDTIKSYIIGKICAEKQEQELILKLKIPFEIFMEILLNNYHPDDIELSETDNGENEQDRAIKMAALALVKLAISGNTLQVHRKFFDLFGDSAYSPNVNHFFIARLLESGYAKFAVTTNFDVLIEKAYKEITKKDLQVYFPSTVKVKSYQFPCLFKVHGGCQELDTIQTTIDKIASNDAKDQCRDIIDYAFNDGKHSKVLILGYSFSDVFDISPSIENIKKSKKSVININHISNTDSLTTRISKISESQSIFQGINGYQINYDTDEIVQTLWRIYFKEVDYNNLVHEKDGHKIEDIIGKWAVQLSIPHQKFFICGLLMMFVGRFEEAKNYFIKCLSTNEIDKNKPFKIAVLQNILAVDPISSSDKKKELDDLLKDADSEAKIKNLINGVQEKLLKGDMEGAVSYCQQAINIAVKMNDKTQEGLCYAALAHVLNEKKEYKKAAELAERALNLIKDVNNFEIIRTRCRIYGYLIASYENLHMEDRRQEYYEKALELAKKLNIENEMAVIYFSLAHSVDVEINKKENLRKSINYFKLGYDFCRGVDSIIPMIKDSSCFLLGANIIMLYLEDSGLVIEEELKLAYELIKDKVTNKTLDKYGGDVIIESVTFMGLACIALKKYDEALEVMLSKICSIGLEDVSISKQKQIINALLIWFQKQAENCCYIPEHKMSHEEITNANLMLQEAHGNFEKKIIDKGAKALNNAFRIIPTNCSFRSSLPYSIYRNIQNIQLVLGDISDTLSSF